VSSTEKLGWGQLSGQDKRGRKTTSVCEEHLIYQTSPVASETW